MCPQLSTDALNAGNPNAGNPNAGNQNAGNQNAGNQEGPGIAWEVIDSPLGPLLLEAEGTALTAIRMAPFHSPEPALRRRTAVIDETARQLGEYFAGARQCFKLPLSPRGTPFQLRVWEALRTIPYGTTTTYGALAAVAGVPGHARAVGSANGANPLSIVIPCHRVIGANGTLTGYAGGLARKAELLALESGLPAS